MVAEADGILIGASRGPDGEAPRPAFLQLKFANRHGLVTGATGTGKTVTLQVLAQAFSDAGVPVFASDVKGDLAGIAAAGTLNDRLRQRAAEVGLVGYEAEPAPTIFWDVFGEMGHPVRTTVSEMGPLLLARLLGLNETQEGILNIAFRIADEDGLLLLDLKDLQALLAHVADRAGELTKLYGNVSKASVGAIQRQLLVLENQGGAPFFGEPALGIEDLMRTTRDGRGYVNVLAAERLMQAPRVYATFLLWLLSELFEDLPEVGDPDRPRLVFFFDEAHLLFDDAPKVLVDKVEQVVKLVRSKGVGVYFVTQNPLDVPESVLAQLGNRIQHALRAYTPREVRAVKVAAETFRPNPEFDTYETITQLGVGEALVSTLGDKGVPSVVERTLIRPPASRMGPLNAAERRGAIAASPLLGQYDKTVDRDSAYEMLARAAAKAADEAAAGSPPARRTDTGLRLPVPGDRAQQRPAPRASRRESVAEAAVKSAARSVASSLGRAIVRGILGSLKR
ncbi:helicase HerA-like domain-containing protein [Faunimonas sp. B44]|uniref:helicase HerA-like domain-containing protein n=1 Tax=Faunimonas sp. B44 TaxID=3461493 RepID=UPI004044AF90